MMEKFRILDFEEYSQVVFLDRDIFSLVSMDYMFDLSETPIDSGMPPLLMENLIITGAKDPAQGGSFIFSPSHDNYLRAMAVIKKTEMAALEMGWPHWDPVVGWRHVIDPSDKWGMATSDLIEPNGPPKTNWT